MPVLKTICGMAPERPELSILRHVAWYRSPVLGRFNRSNCLFIGKRKVAQHNGRIVRPRPPTGNAHTLYLIQTFRFAFFLHILERKKYPFKHTFLLRKKMNTIPTTS